MIYSIYKCKIHKYMYVYVHVYLCVLEIRNLPSYEDFMTVT